MRLDQGMCEPALLKGDLLIYCEEPTGPFRLAPSSYRNLSITESGRWRSYIMISNLEMMSFGSAISVKMPLSPDGKGHIRYY